MVLFSFLSEYKFTFFFFAQGMKMSDLIPSKITKTSANTSPFALLLCDSIPSPSRGSPPTLTHRVICPKVFSPPPNELMALYGNASLILRLPSSNCDFVEERQLWRLREVRALSQPFASYVLIQTVCCLLIVVPKLCVCVMYVCVSVNFLPQVTACIVHLRSREMRRTSKGGCESKWFLVSVCA